MPLYKSRNGIGFPSCSRALVRVPRNTNDPGGYYAEIGVAPDATHNEIRRAVRRLYRIYHTDGSFPDADKFRRIKSIAEVLLNPTSRAKYDRTPKGERLLDAVYAEELRQVLSPNEIQALLQTIKPKSESRFFDYFSDSQDPGDVFVANEWYAQLVKVAPAVGYSGVIKVMLCQGEPAWLEEGHILLVPRTWNPTSANAFALLNRFISRRVVTPTSDHK